MKDRAPRLRDTGFRDFVLDQLAGLPGVEARAMFGGHGLYLRGVFFAILHDGRMWFRTGPHNRAGYEARGMTAFAPNPRQTLKNYLEVPGEIVEDAGLLREWTLAAARRQE